MSYSLATRLERAVKNSGLNYKKVSGWASRGHGAMGTIQSVMCHHTAGPASGNTPSLNVVTYGRPGLSGPLAQLFLARDGTPYLVAAGRAYHAGRVSSGAYQNSHSIGIEAEATGTSSWPDAQIEAYARLCRALVREFDLPTSRVAGHKEKAVPHGRKIDPNFSMSDFRKKVDGAKGGVGQGSSAGGGGSKYESPSAKHEVGSRVMGLYDGGNDVNWYQRRMYKLGYNVTPKKDGSFDSLFGPEMVTATKQLQKAANITVDGLAGKDAISAAKAADVKRDLPTVNKSSKPSAKKAPKFPLPAGSYFGPKSGPNSSVSGYYSHREHLRVWQKQMQKRGWTIKADGLWGSETSRVAGQFQKQKHLGYDKLVGPETWAAAWTEPIT